MKKLMMFVFALACVPAFVGCNNTQANSQTEQFAVYSFSGEHEQFTIANGVIVFSGAEEVFDGGDLEVIQDNFFTDITSYCTTFYTIKDGEKSVILSNRVVDLTGGSVKLDGDLGKVTGDHFLTGSKAANADELKYNLWFELNTTDGNGETNTYQLQLALTEIITIPTE